KRDLLSEADVAAAVTTMTTLNAGAARAMLGVGVHAATDVTGFGLLGHLRTLLEASGAAAEVRAAAVRSCRARPRRPGAGLSRAAPSGTSPASPMRSASRPAWIRRRACSWRTPRPRAGS